MSVFQLGCFHRVDGQQTMYYVLEYTVRGPQLFRHNVSIYAARCCSPAKYHCDADARPCLSAVGAAGMPCFLCCTTKGCVLVNDTSVALFVASLVVMATCRAQGRDAVYVQCSVLRGPMGRRWPRTAERRGILRIDVSAAVRLFRGMRQGSRYAASDDTSGIL